MSSSTPAFHESPESEVADHPTFLDSHRAAAVWVREFGKLVDGVQGDVGALAPVDDEKPVIRRTPTRCIVQLGPVALTVSWLRNAHDSTAELLVIVWSGGVAPKRTLYAERPALQQTTVAATALWEQALVAEASSEASWTWRARDEGLPTCTSAQLARLLVERLCSAYRDARVSDTVA